MVISDFLYDLILFLIWKLLNALENLITKIHLQL